MDIILNELYLKIQSVRQKLTRTINVTVLQTYWEVGKYIVEYEQK